MSVTSVIVPEPEVTRARPARARRQAAKPVFVPRWRRVVHWVAHPRRAYTALILASSAALVVGIGLIYVPLAFIVAGLAGGGLGLLGLGITVRGAR